ncbi:MAG: hypothetical protein WKF90_16700, partial [Pyrinomonadaceae bacterium]
VLLFAALLTSILFSCVIFDFFKCKSLSNGDDCAAQIDADRTIFLEIIFQRVDRFDIQIAAVRAVFFRHALFGDEGDRVSFFFFEPRAFGENS